MPGRFPIITDENIPGPVVQGLKDAGCDVVRTIDVFGQRSVDEMILAWSADQGRVLVTTAIAHRLLREMRSFRMVFWPQVPFHRVRVGSILNAFEDLARREEPFSACLVHLRVAV